MSIQFSRSIRSLHIDSFRSSRIGLIIGSMLMLLLILWFFFAKVSVHETSQDVRLSQDGTFIAVFTDEAMIRIQPGMEALIRILTIADQPPLTLEGIVFDTDPQSNQVEIVSQSPDFFDLPEVENFSAQADIEIESVTPFRLVQRFSGQVVESESTPESPQPNTPLENP